MTKTNYLMESDDESLRLELKTDDKKVVEQATWAGIKAGMRVADLGCGPGKTTAALQKLVQAGGETVGIDFSEKRLSYANKHYREEGITFRCRDIRQPLEELGEFDFVWVRFVLEYYLSDAVDIVNNILRILKPGGIICLIDLDNNCLNHFDIPDRLERTIYGIMAILQDKSNFDPFAGRKLYSHLFNQNLDDITVQVAGHHVIYGNLGDSDAFNWLKKAEIAPQKIGFNFDEYDGGREEFLEEFNTFFHNPARFTYSPIILCRGIKPIT
jgi:ubiquinone/menaquinone biosynthesis C-methylase UbiE